jgi:hypothetical protein
MENLNFINPLLHGIIPDDKGLKISAKHLVCAGIATLVAGAVLKKAGHNKTAALVGSIALPLLASACYKKFATSSKSNTDTTEPDVVTEHA